MSTAVRLNQLDMAPRAKERAVMAFARGEWEMAASSFADHLQQEPADAEALNYRARALVELERTPEALEAIDRALAVNPDNVADLRNRGVLLRRLGRLQEALEAFEWVLARRPEDQDLLVKRVHLLHELDRREEALTQAESLLAKYPAEPIAFNARGVVLESLQRYQDAQADFERILSVKPGDIDAVNNLGMVKARQGCWEEALQLYDRSLSVKPNQPQARYNRSIVRLALGDWARGLVEFECRWELPPLKAVLLKSPAPRWTGREPIEGKTLLVYHEQGYGDTLQFARYVESLMHRGARVIFAVPAGLRRLMTSLAGSPTVISDGDPLPPHDLQCPLMSLLPALGVSPESIEPQIWYLSAVPSEVALWRTRLGPRRRPRIGVVWSGRRYAPINYPRDMPLEQLKPLLELEADFFSLQTEISPTDAETLASLPHLNAGAATTHLHDFGDTAALIEALDLVITVDTAIAHLAGALGKPVWLLNRFSSCWRWGQRGSQTAWYPSMTIFRQSSVGDWASVVRQVEAAARAWIGQLKYLNAEQLYHAGPCCPPRVTPSRRPAQETIRFVCATRHTTAEFLRVAPLGRSLPLYRSYPRGQRIELRLFPNNKQGLPSVYNVAIEEAKSDPAILVFIHDDVHLSDYFWAEHLRAGLREFDIVGLAGNIRRVPGQASWMYLNDEFVSDSYENLSGVLGHGEGFPNLKQLSVYGEPGQQCQLLDGVFLAAESEMLNEFGLLFDPRFEFDFYDLDFCRQAEVLGRKMGTWPISIIHASAGKLGSDSWRRAYRAYLLKYHET